MKEGMILRKRMRELKKQICSKEGVKMGKNKEGNKYREKQ